MIEKIEKTDYAALLSEHMSAGELRETFQMCIRDRCGIFIEREWGSSGAVALTGGTAEAVRSFANTNLMVPLAVIPTIRQRLEPGKHMVINWFMGDPGSGEHDCKFLENE